MASFIGIAARPPFDEKEDLIVGRQARLSMAGSFSPEPAATVCGYGYVETAGRPLAGSAWSNAAAPPEPMQNAERRMKNEELEGCRTPHSYSSFFILRSA